MCTAIMVLVGALMLLINKLRGKKSSFTLKCPFGFLNRKSAPTTPPGTEPGLGWQEAFIDGSPEAEAAFIESAMTDINLVQGNNKKSARASGFSRAFHAKIQAGIANAEFRILPDLPEQLRTGLFQPGKAYPAKIRLSSAAGKDQPDTAKDLRGIGVRIDDVLDLLATNGSASHARDARQFVLFAKAMSGSKLLVLPRLIWSVGLFETVRMFRTVLRQVSRKTKSLTSETYFSRAPFAIGAYAVKFQLTPYESRESGVKPSASYLREDLVELVKQGPVVFAFQIQYFIDETRTPIEDGSVEWDSPLITIALLVIPQQDLSSQAAVEAQNAVEELQFNPWNVPADKSFTPLGSLNRARRLVYRASVALRTGTFLPFFNERSSMKNESKSGCPFGFGSAKTEGAKTDGETSTPSNGLWRPTSSRVGIGPVTYVIWNAFYWVMETLNRGLSRNPYRKVSWDKWPTSLGLMYLLAKIKFNRSNALTDPYDYATNDNKSYGAEPEAAKHGYTADGSWVLDNDNPQMGTPGTRFGSNIPPKKVRPDVEEMTPSSREVGKLRWRRLDENGKEITIPALILNDLSGGWIQFQFHNFGGNTMRDPVSQCPHLMKRDAKDNWPGGVAVIDRTSKDPTRVTDNGRPTILNEKVVSWVQGQIYGSNEDELNLLRSLEGGKMKVDDNLRLPEDPNKPGIDQTGFNNNYNPLLSLLHWLFVSEHNAIAEHYAFFNPKWDDETLFQMARKVNVAQIARIHTIQWTEDLLQHPTLQMGMHADWYGLLGQKAKMYLMRLSHRFPLVHKLLTPFRHNDTIWGMVGSKWEHHDGPFQLPKHFRMVYRLHEMVLGEREIIEPGTNRLLERVDLLNFIHSNTRPLVSKYGYEVLAWSFVKKSCGALTLHNLPRAMTQFQNQQDGTWTDIAERDIFRERTDGTGTYNEFRHSVGEPPVTSFMELTGGDAELARELEIKYEGDVDAVDAGIGILAEPKPDGFALGFCQFYQFVLNAPRRVKSNRHLTEGFTYAEYRQGMDWVEHGGGMLGAMKRHLPGISAQMEGVTRAFAPWKDTETFPLRQLDKAHEDTAKVFKTDLRSLVIAIAAAVAAVASGAMSMVLVVHLLVMLGIVPVCLTVRRMLAMRYMQLCWKKCYTDKRSFMFGTLTRAERSIERAARYGSLHALAVMVGSAGLALTLATSYPVLAVLLGALALSAAGTRKWSHAFAADAHVLFVALRNRMREGQAPIDPSTLTGATAIEKRSAFNAEVERCLRAGVRCEKRAYSAAGDVNEAEVELLFRSYAPGRDHLTAYDMRRMVEGDNVRDAAEGRGNWLTRWWHARSANKSNAELLHTYADMVVEEDKQLVPAISRKMVMAFYDGTAQAQVKREREEGDRDPSPAPRR